MAYSELIKNFSGIRSYMRSFYVYGFRHRDEYDEKSARGYDNERRRIEPLLRSKSEPKRSAGILDIPFALDRAGNVVSIEFLIHRDFCWNAFLSGKNRLDRQAVLDAVILGACFNYTPEES